MSGGAFADRNPRDRAAYWQGVDSGRLLLMASAAMLIAAAFAHTALQPRGAIQWQPALAFGGFIALGELLRLELPGGREAAPIAVVGAMSYALLLTLPPESTHLATQQSALLVIAVAAVGMGVGAVPHIAAGRRPVSLACAPG